MTDLNVLLSSISLTTESLLYPRPFPYSALLLLALKDPNHRLSYNRLNLITSIIPNFSREFSKKTRDKAKFPSFISTRNFRKIKIFHNDTFVSELLRQSSPHLFENTSRNEYISQVEIRSNGKLKKSGEGKASKNLNKHSPTETRTGNSRGEMGSWSRVTLVPGLPTIVRKCTETWFSPPEFQSPKRCTRCSVR